MGSLKPDPAALALVAYELRDLLRHHERMGIKWYSRTSKLSTFFKADRREPQRLPPSSRRSRVPQQAVGSSNRVAASRPEEVPPEKVTSVESIAAISSDIVSCKRCDFNNSIPSRVLGQGSDHPKLMVVGDYCGGNQDSSRESVLGINEDEMLWNMMKAIGLSREEVYATNLLKCRVVETDKPDPATVSGCISYLAREIASLRPKIICAMGELTARQILGRSEPLVRLRGVFHNYRYAEGGEFPVIATFHPRFLLANPEMKKAAWQDLQRIQRRLANS